MKDLCAKLNEKSVPAVVSGCLMTRTEDSKLQKFVLLDDGMDAKTSADFRVLCNRNWSSKQPINLHQP